MNTTQKTAYVLHKSVLAAALVGILSVTSGCFLVAVGAAGAAGAGTVAYIKGELDATLANRLDAVVNATDSALAQLQFAKVNENRDAFSAVIIARTADDKKIEIKASKQADNLTKLEIRIGTFGDETLSRAILDKTKSNL